MSLCVASLPTLGAHRPRTRRSVQRSCFASAEESSRQTDGETSVSSSHSVPFAIRRATWKDVKAVSKVLYEHRLICKATGDAARPCLRED